MASRTVSICRALFVPESYATTKTHSEMHSSIDMVSGSPGFEKKRVTTFVERLSNGKFNYPSATVLLLLFTEYQNTLYMKLIMGISR